MSDLKIPSADPKADYAQHAAEISQAIQNVLQSGQYILGPDVKLFEETFAKFVGVENCVSVNSGTDSLVLALKALEVGVGDEVITVSHTSVATVAAIELVGALPVLIDIDPDTYCLDPKKLDELVSSKTKAIIPVHLYGQPANMDPILEFAHLKKIAVIEDCSQAHGATIRGKMVGGFGDLACFSFYPTKNLGAIGDGGAVVTNRSDLAEKLRLLHQYGWEERYISKLAGINSRMDELQAAILNVKLPFLPEKIHRRRAIASIYDQRLADTGFVLPKHQSGTEHAMHLYVIQADKRDELQAFMKENGVGTGIHYPLAVHQQPAYLGRLRGSNELPVTEKIVPRILSLPMYPQLSDENVHRVCDLLVDWSKHY
ncbi:MAG: DegT/DnrJ/EryC1/StrS family aminotransferase [Anaerolineaceae bacterium]|jgi:dTDP-4-amino-4,6-dideoxygalactose transaminase